MIINELKSGNILTKALSPAKTMAKGKGQGQTRATVRASAPHIDEAEAGSSPKISFKNRHIEYR